MRVGCEMARGPAVAAVAGGFVRVEVGAILAAWRACHGRRGGMGDFRAYLAAREMAARRARATATGRTPRFGLAELAGLCGVGERRARDAVRRLVAAGLVEWREDAVAFPATMLSASVPDCIPGGSGLVAIPRRLLRWLARGARPATLAVALAALLRCVSRRRDGWRDRGRLKASWVAEAFGVDERRAKAARAELVALGWLEPEAGNQRAWNRWGRAFRVRLDWARPAVAQCHPSPADPGRTSPPPLMTPLPSREGSDPDPAECGPGGVEPRRDEVRPPAPTLRDVRPEDLADTARALSLHAQAVARGVVPPGEASRLRWVATAEHACRVGLANPPGLFAAIVRAGRWGLLTQADEDAARARLRLHDRPAPPSQAAPRAAPRPGPLYPSAAAPPPSAPSSLRDVLARMGIGTASTGGAVEGDRRFGVESDLGPGASFSGDHAGP